MEHVIAKHGTKEYVSHLSPKKAKSEALKKKKESVRNMGKPPNDHYGSRIDPYKRPKDFER